MDTEEKSKEMTRGKVEKPVRRYTKGKNTRDK